MNDSKDDFLLLLGDDKSDFLKCGFPYLQGESVRSFLDDDKAQQLAQEYFLLFHGRWNRLRKMPLIPRQVNYLCNYFTLRFNH